jgi:hypothetical protein
MPLQSGIAVDFGDDEGSSGKVSQARISERQFRSLGFSVEAEMPPATPLGERCVETGPEHCILKRSVVCCRSACKPKRKSWFLWNPAEALLEAQTSTFFHPPRRDGAARLCLKTFAGREGLAAASSGGCRAFRLA